MHLPEDKSESSKVPQKSIFINAGRYIKSVQLESGAIPSNKDGSHLSLIHI